MQRQSHDGTQPPSNKRATKPSGLSIKPFADRMPLTGKDRLMETDVQKQALRRLAIIKGQVEGLERMIREDTYCVDVLVQVSAIHEALRGVGKVIVQNHLRTCVDTGVKKGQGEKHYHELMDIIYKLSK